MISDLNIKIESMKKVDQLLPNGEVILDYDQPIRISEEEPLFKSLFGDKVRKEKDIRIQFIIGEKLALLVKAVTYLGNPWQSYKKRIQLPIDFREQYLRNIRNHLSTLFVGIYRYESLRMYVVFEPGTYAIKKSHNSSAHVQTFDLQYALEAGIREKDDAMQNHIRVMTEGKFKEFILHRMFAEEHSTFAELRKLIEEYLNSWAATLPRKWKGIDCYKEMMEAGDNNAKQGEWQGFYFEFLFKKMLKERPTKLIEWCNDKTRNGIDFDLKFPEIPWGYGDLKSDGINNEIQGNSFDTFDKVILEHSGKVYYIVCFYKFERDKDHGYKVTRYWNQFRDKPYETEEEIQNRYGRRMKYSVTPVEIRILAIDAISYAILKKDPFYQGVNSDGRPREPKLKIDKKLIENLTVHVIPIA